MKTKIILILATVTAGCIIVATLYKSQPAVDKPVAQNMTPPTPEKIQPTDIPAPSVDLAVEKVVEISPAPEKPVAQPKPQTSAARSPAKQKEPLHDPDARVALGLVGADPAAETYWLSAISDTSLPDQEREDLMEDLNEDGLSDPKHPGPEDLPLIVNRLALIEEIAPNADPFMQEHLGEAYKDLNNLLAGRPVQ